MGLLITAAGLIVLLYTASSVLGLWLAGKAAAARGYGAPLEPPLSEAPPHHVALLSDYATGVRGTLWRISIVCLVVTLVSMVFGSPLTPYAFGIALIIDSYLFLSYPRRVDFVAATTSQERLIDAAQCSGLLIAFAILFWTRTIIA
jgi:hypothetical protein